MSVAAVERLAAAGQALARALDGGTATEIDGATEVLARALSAVQAVGAWQPTPELGAAIRRALRHGEAARIRTRYLAEYGRQRLARLHALTGNGPVGYGRDGRHR